MFQVHLLMAQTVYDCRAIELVAKVVISTKCSTDIPYCCNNTYRCCVYNRRHEELWETWYFWLGITLIALFVLTSALSYAVAYFKRKQQNLIRIHNVATPSSPPISTVSGPGGIIQPKIDYSSKGSHLRATAFITSTDLYLEDFAGPLDPPYPAIQPITVVRGSVPPQGFRHTQHYTELVLPPGYVDTDYHFKHTL
ncbi:uncharacterized protein LOC124606920 isoform X1 [Schistocerca americana]|nr:uncharacterized protein LOC124606920 isoform X1 [Schistocerca americana]XP_046994986.1 uncharacterized protein LOC124606920 isoform X1 [Schistocerca americana]